MRDGFVYLDQAVPGIICDAKYFGSDNFTGGPVDGYGVNRAIGSLELASALKRALASARDRGFAFVVWDAYRPARAVERFLRWAASPEDGKTKARHYPNIDKKDIVPLGYVAEKSGHSRGGAVDLTLCDIATGETLEMGGGFDLMDISSHHGARGISPTASENRALLRGIMERNGFAAYENEWWHYSLINEPYPDAYFDFPIE